MLLIFWDIKEELAKKREIEKLLEDTYAKLVQISPFRKFKRHSISLIFSNSQAIKKINNDYRNKNISTDVLSFSEQDFKLDNPFLKDEQSLGEIYINYQWKEAGLSQSKLFSQLFVHGLLHLIGFDHEIDKGEMERIENSLKRKFFDDLQ